MATLYEQPSAASDRLLGLGLLAVVVAPLVVAVVALRKPTWYPVLDLAMTEYRLRDVATGYTPLIGLPGRIGRTIAEQGSHPGPVSFYALAPIYKALGSTAWAMQVATVVIHTAASGVALFLAHRRGGRALMVGSTAVLAVLLHSYGVSVLTEPWNPYMPVIWWFVFLLAVWSVLDHDLAALPVAVVAATFCAQTHVPYVPITAGLSAVAVVGVVVSYRRAGDTRQRAIVKWVAASLGISVVLWLPPIIDQLVNDPGNFSRLADHFTNPPEEAVGAREGMKLTFEHLDLGTPLASRGRAGWTVRPVAGTRQATAPALALLGVWAASAAVALRRRDRTVVALHAVVAGGLLLGGVAMARIFGNVWYYLTLWAWGLTALVLLAIGLTAARVLASSLDDRGRLLASRIATAGALAVIAIASLSFAVEAADAPPPAERLSSTLGALVESTAKALEDGMGPANGRAGRYVITWSDALHIGSQAYGLVNELERRGFDVGMTHGLTVPLTPQRIVKPGEATAEIHFATGVNIAPFAELPGVVQVAVVDPRSPAERAEFEQLRSDAIEALEGDGLYDVVPLVDSNLFAASIGPRVPTGTRKILGRMLDLGEPAAVFIAPAGTSPM